MAGRAWCSLGPLDSRMRAVPGALGCLASGSGVDGLEITLRCVSPFHRLPGALKAVQRWRLGQLEKADPTHHTAVVSALPNVK